MTAKLGIGVEVFFPWRVFGRSRGGKLGEERVKERRRSFWWLVLGREFLVFPLFRRRRPETLTGGVSPAETGVVRRVTN